MKPFISVIIPIYNGESYLANTIKYLEQQSFRDFEVIFVDDASTDDTFSQLCAISKNSLVNIQIERIEVNSGCAMARNRGIDKACGEYVLCLDADDYYYLNMLERLYQTAVKYQPDVVAFSSWMIDCSTGEKRSFGQWKRLEKLLEDNSTEYVCNNPRNHPDISELIDYVAWSKMINREYFLANNLWFPKFEYYEDISFSFLCILKSQKTVFVTDKMLEYYRNTQAGMTSWKKPKEHYMVDAFHLILEEFKEQPVLYDRLLGRALRNLNAVFVSDTTLNEDKNYIMNKLAKRGYYDWEIDDSFNNLEIVKKANEMKSSIERYFVPILKGDTIGICAMSNPVEGKSIAEVEAVTTFMENYGLTVNDNSFVKETTKKIDTLNCLFLEKEVKYIFDVSGGDLANEVIASLDYENIKKSDAIFVGYSDLTVVINAIYKMTGKPSILYRINNVIKERSDIQRKRIEETLFRGDTSLFEFDYHFYQGDSMKGIVVGGNIRCLLKLAGTKYWPDLKGKILFLESQDDDLTTVRAEVAQLNQIGVFSDIDGLVIGLFGMNSDTDNMKIDDYILKCVGPNLPVAKTKEIGHSFSSKAIVIGGNLKLKSKEVK